MGWATTLPKPPRNLHDVGPMAKMSDSVVSGPVRRVMVGTDRSQTASRAVAWYERLRFRKEWEHQFEPGFPWFVSVARGRARLYLSEHKGDARPNTLIHLYVTDIDAVSDEFGVPVDEEGLAGRECDPAFLTSLYQSTKGNPLFVVESVRASLEPGASGGSAPPVTTRAPSATPFSM